jgi:hypothetical protein
VVWTYCGIRLVSLAAVWTLVILSPSAMRAESGGTYLSKLSASAGSPLFTTYAAPMQRSQFVIDQGYQLIWNDTTTGADCTTEKAGKLCLGFKLNGEFRYALGRYASPPIVTISYSDLFRYHAYPFLGIRVEAFFQVYSSQMAVQDVVVTNEGSAPADLAVYPFLVRSDPGVTNVQFLPAGDGFTFKHQEPPDGWTVDHGVPFQSDRIDAWLLDTVAASHGGYSSLGKSHVSRKSAAVRSNYCVEWGTLTHPDGSPCLHLPPAVAQCVFHGGNLDEVLTEDTPKWGDPDPNIPGNGYQGCELGHFFSPAIAAGDSFRVVVACATTQGRGESFGTVPPLPAAAGVQVNVQCHTAVTLAPPQNVALQLSADSSVASLAWTAQAGWMYHIYRRTEATPGHFHRVAASITQGSWSDEGLNPDTVYSYVVIGEDALGNLSSHSREISTADGATREFFADVMQPLLWNGTTTAPVTVLAMQRNFHLAPGATGHLRIFRGVTGGSGQPSSLADSCRALRALDLQNSVAEDEKQFAHVPRLTFVDPDAEMLYWSAFNLMHQMMLPPEGKCSYPYYVFSREPQWGWGHGGQVFHESLTMLAAALMDSSYAMGSQRVFMERQQPDGYINYRTGPYLDEQIPYAGQLTSSAPWFSFENWELYTVTHDHQFLSDAYASGTRFYRFWQKNRDADGDSLCEWGGHAVLESVRDGLVAVWDQVCWPSLVEGLDLNTMLVSEARALQSMATELGLPAEAAGWEHEAVARAARINTLMWDDATGFYYHVGRQAHSFSLAGPGDLKRQEIIGFLPLWAGVASPERASSLVATLTNPSKFWRAYGVPSLAADDPYFNSKGYWNGPVWVQWNYLIFRGLLNYGYVDVARELLHRVSSAMIVALKQNHSLWELYSPDDEWAGWNRQYIWAGIIARMMFDMQQYGAGAVPVSAHRPTGFSLEQNYPNPFNPSTGIGYRVSGFGMVTLKVYDLLGREVATLVNERKEPGRYVVAWDASKFSSGIYLCTLKAGSFVQTRKLVLVH